MNRLLLIVVITLLIIDISVKCGVVYIPAYKARQYAHTHQDQFNQTVSKIISITETTEKTVSTLKMFFENKFISTLCRTETGKYYLGPLCPDQKRTTFPNKEQQTLESVISDLSVSDINEIKEKIITFFNLLDTKSIIYNNTTKSYYRILDLPVNVQDKNFLCKIVE